MGRKRILSFVVVVAILLGAGELFARYGLGLGTPPLSLAHSEIEYLFAPNQDVQRFGNRVLINAYGMRNADFATEKPAGEFRVMVFGDSVLNGGSLTDHADLATTLLADRLAALKGVSVVVGNISAGSWGPGNWLAYAREYGFFDADVVLLLISSHDARDNPNFAALDPATHPQSRPFSALTEGMTRYLPRYLPSFGQAGETVLVGAVSMEPDHDLAIARGSADLRAFLSLARAAAARVLVVQFPERSELEAGGLMPGGAIIRSIAQEEGVPVFSVAPALEAALSNGDDPYRDDIHINGLGQAILADVFFDALGDFRD
jgi:lysophospholipase L1-like esterase